MISMIIPTKNRSQFLARQLKYYSEMGFDGPILVGDSSNGNHLKDNKELISTLDSNLSIVYLEYPTLVVHRCVQQLVNLVRTPYIVHICDDDFLVPSGLEKCRLFLDNHRDYVAAHGVAAKIRTKNCNPHGEIIMCKQKMQPVEETESASARYLHFIGHMSDVYFSVHRTEVMVWSCDKLDYFSDGHFYNVLGPNCFSVVRGKIKELDCLSLVRHMQDNPHRTREEIDMLFWITSPKWLSSYQNFCDILAAELATCDSITREEALQVVKQGVLIYLTKRLENECRKNYPGYANPMSDFKGAVTARERIRSLLRGLIQHTPGVQRAIRTWKDLGIISPARSLRNDLSLQALLNLSSQYHKDFMPIYRAITNPPVEIK